MSNVEYAHDIDGSIIVPKTAEQMTELNKAKLAEIISRTDKTGNEKLEMLVEFSNKYTLHIAEQAVEDEVDTCQYEREEDEVRVTCYSILTRIKNEIGE